MKISDENMNSRQYEPTKAYIIGLPSSSNMVILITTSTTTVPGHTGSIKMAMYFFQQKFGKQRKIYMFLTVSINYILA